MSETTPIVTPLGRNALAVRPHRFRLYAAAAGQPRARRAADLILLAPALLGLALLIFAYPPSELERSLDAFVDSVPGWLDPLWGLFYGLLAIWAVALLVVAAVARRWLVAMQALGALAVAATLAIVSARLAVGEWPDVTTSIGWSEPRSFPSIRIAEAVAVSLTVAPHLVRPLRSVGSWVLLLGVIGAVLADQAGPGGAIAAILIAVAAAAAVRLASGTSVGRPGLPGVADALSELGVAVHELESGERQIDGVFTARGHDESGRPLLVKVWGRDAYDNQLLTKFWRSLLYRDGGPALGLTRAQGVEHEALATLLAAHAGVPTREVVTAGTTDDGDALLVLRGAARALATVPEEGLDDALLRRCWETLARLGDANIAHLRIDPTTIVAIGDEIGFVDFGGATLAPSYEQLLADRAQLLAASTALVGSERAVRAATVSLGSESVAALLPYLQPTAFSGPLRKALKDADIDIDELREQAAKNVGAEPPELAKLRRVTWGSLVQAALLVLTATVLISALGDVDFAQVGSDLADASWGWVALGFVVAQLPRLTQAIATLGSIAARLPYGPVYAMQLATSYMNLAVPTSFARMAINVRFFQRQGVPPPSAISSGAIDSFSGNVVQALMLVAILALSEATLAITLRAPSGGPAYLLWILVGLVVVLVVAAVVVAVLLPKVRRTVVEHVRDWAAEVRATGSALRSWNKLALLVGGNVATEVLFATALGLFALGLGSHISLTDLLVINISTSLLSSFVPVPGGVGVTEFCLMIGLTSAGMDESAAFATVFLYRVSTFYLPPIWGWFALRWLKRNRYL